MPHLKHQNISLALGQNLLPFFSTTMVKETMQYYSENGGKPVRLLLLDDRKAFHKVAYDMLFKVLNEKMWIQKLCIPINNVMFSGEMLALIH